MTSKEAAPPYVIPKGTVVRVRKPDQRQWREHVTTKHMEIRGHEVQLSNNVMLKRDGWLMLVPRSYLESRE